MQLFRIFKKIMFLPYRPSFIEDIRHVSVGKTHVNNGWIPFSFRLLVLFMLNHWLIGTLGLSAAIANVVCYTCAFPKRSLL